jgi:hypothetical protein
MDPNPDPGGPKTCGSGSGSGSPTLVGDELAWPRRKFYKASVLDAGTSLRYITNERKVPLKINGIKIDFIFSFLQGFSYGLPYTRIHDIFIIKL